MSVMLFSSVGFDRLENFIQIVKGTAGIKLITVIKREIADCFHGQEFASSGEFGGQQFFIGRFGRWLLPGKPGRAAGPGFAPAGFPASPPLPVPAS